MFVIVYSDFSYPLVGVGATMSEAWDCLQEAVDAAGEVMPAPNSEMVEYYKGVRLESVEAKTVWEIGGKPA